MKAFYKVSVLGCLLIALVASTATVSFAQEDEKTKLYNDVVNNYEAATDFDEDDIASMEEALPKIKTAISAGETFKTKFPGAENKEIIAWIDSQLPTWKSAVKTIEKRIPVLKREKEERIKKNQRFSTFNSSYNGKNWTQMFKVGDEIVANYPEVALDVSLQMAKSSFDLVFYDKQDAFSPQAMKYSTMALKLLNSGKTSKNYGVFDIYKTPKFQDGKSNALGNMNFHIGWLKFYKEKKGDEAIPYLFKVSKINSSKQKNDLTYSSIGRHYITSVQKFIKKQSDLLSERNAEADKDEPDLERIKMLDYEVDLAIANLKGYAERAIDAYLRSYGTLSAEDKNSDFGKKMFSDLKTLYSYRYPGKAELQTPDKINADLAAINTKVMPDPQSKVMPIDAPLKPAAKPAETDEKTGETRSRTVSKNN